MPFVTLMPFAHAPFDPHAPFIELTKRNADVILPHGANGPAVDIITTKVRSLLQEMGWGWFMLSFPRAG